MPDYSKFDRIVDSDDDDEHSEGLPSLEEKRTVPSLLAQHDAMMQIVDWLKELHMVTGLSEADNAKLVRFISVQDKVITPDESKRYAAITSFLEEDASWSPPIVALVALCHLSEERTNSESDENKKLTGARAMLLAMSSLNMLAACYVHGASKLIRLLEEQPNGELAGRLERFEFATELVAKRPPGFSADTAEMPKQQQQQQQRQQQQLRQRQAATRSSRQLGEEPRERTSATSPVRERLRLPLLSRVLRVTAPATRWLREVGTSIRFQGCLLLFALTVRFCVDQVVHGHSTFWFLGGHEPQALDELKP